MLALPVKSEYIKIKYVNRLQCRKTAAENPNKSELDFISLPSYSGLTPNFAYRKIRHAALSTVFAVASTICYSSKQKENFNKCEKKLLFFNKHMGLRHYQIGKCMYHLPASYPHVFKIPEHFPVDIGEASHLVYSISQSH